MTDAQISYALALAIGWPAHFVWCNDLGVAVWNPPEWKPFDYRDRTVWGGLVEGYRLALRWSPSLEWYCGIEAEATWQSTPAKAVALLVIELAKQGKLPERRA